MMQRFMKSIFTLLLFVSVSAVAQQQQTFGKFEVHYNAFNSSMLTADVAKAYGIQRSNSRALVNITVLTTNNDGGTEPVKARVTATGRNLTGQTREIDMREIIENNEAIYYIGELTARNQEMFEFTVLITPVGSDRPFTLKFRQQFYSQ